MMLEFIESISPWAWLTLTIFGLLGVVSSFRDHWKMMKAQEFFHSVDWELIRLMARRGTTDAEFARAIAGSIEVEMAEVIRRCQELIDMIGDE